MKIEGLKIHRKLSWLLALFSFVVVIIIILRNFLEIYSFYPILHLSVEWILMGFFPFTAFFHKNI